MPEYVLGIDVGTTSVKAVLLSSQQSICNEASVPHDLISLHPGWAEEDADTWWNGVVSAVHSLLKQNPSAKSGIRAIGVSGMVPALVLLDSNMRPLRNTVQQNDARAIPQIDRIRGALDQDKLFANTGGFTNAQHVLPRLLWIKENEKEIYDKCACVMGSYDYIVFRLTGEAGVEIGWAAESGLFDIYKREWINEYPAQFGIDPNLFLQVRDSGTWVGGVSVAAARETGLPAGIPVIAGAADHVASAFAAGVAEPGDLLIKFGGAGDMLFCTDRIAPIPELYFDYHIVPGRYLPNGCMASSGSLVKWLLKDIFGTYDIAALAALDRQAERLSPGSDGLIVLPYFCGEKTPIFDAEARGVFYGLTLSHGRAHLFRAVLEAVIYGFRHHLDILQNAGCNITNVYATNGGAKSAFWCQIAADVLGYPIRSFAAHPGSSLGVGFLAGKQAGMYDAWSGIRAFLTAYQDFEPNPAHVAIYQEAYKIYRELYEAVRPFGARVGEMYRAGSTAPGSDSI